MTSRLEKMMKKCACIIYCGDDGDHEGDGICKNLPLPPKPPLVEIVLVHRDELI